MKKVILVAAIVGLGIVSFMLVRNRMGINFSMKATYPGQITLTNDSNDTISVEYKLGDEKVAMVLPKGETIPCGSNGFVQIFTANKAGSYELTYPDDSSDRAVKLSQIVETAKKDNTEGAIYTEKGMLGDIKVVYEQIMELDATY